MKNKIKICLPLLFLELLAILLTFIAVSIGGNKLSPIEQSMKEQQDRADEILRGKNNGTTI